MKKRRNSPLGSKHDRQDDFSSEVDPRVQPGAGTSPEYPLKIRHLIMSQQGRNLLKFLNKDQTRQQFCDVRVSVGGNLYRAHKVVLAHGSSYFHAELSKNPATEHVTLEHVEDSVFQHLLELLYTSQCFILEKDLPALTRAARFLDMMDVLKLLSGDSDGAGATQEEGGAGRAAGSGESAAAEADLHCPGSLGSSGSVPGNASDSPQSQPAQAQPDVCQEPPAGTEKTTTSTRRSTRRRRTPSKYQRNSAACTSSTPGNAESATQETPEEAEAWKPTEICRAAQETEGTDEDEGGMNEDDACLADKQDGQSVPEAETGSSAQGPVYPEGLAPVIIHISNKKTLKCPKCEKTFDRAGGTLRLQLQLFSFEKVIFFFNNLSSNFAPSCREVSEPHEGAHGGEALPV